MRIRFRTFDRSKKHKIQPGTIEPYERHLYRNNVVLPRIASLADKYKLNDNSSIQVVELIFKLCVKSCSEPGLTRKQIDEKLMHLKTFICILGSIAKYGKKGSISVPEALEMFLKIEI